MRSQQFFTLHVPCAQLPGISGILQKTWLATWRNAANTFSVTEPLVDTSTFEKDYSKGLGERQADWRSSQVSKARLTDFTAPASWYPAARKLQRTIIAHVGPTNSGKTHQALSALKAAETGAYCGPLRLLAWEVAEKMNAAGVPCNLMTGQEKKLQDGAQHIASTVEMASVTHGVDVGVVDEVQMVGDPVRGSSFTRAILGLPARTLHVCGDPAVLPLLHLMAQDAGDRLEVRHYERLAPLSAGRRPLPSITSAQRGDCLIAFSRRDVHSIKRQIEERGRHSCCLVYGALPPESRAQQAELFNTARTGYNVLAASDAVGMGLNLNIRRIIFTSLQKFDGIAQRPLTPAEIKQIAGRAGRYGSKYSAGIVTTLNPADLSYLKLAMTEEVPPVEQACLFPRFQQIALFIHQNPAHTLPSALRVIADRARMADHYMLGDFDNMYRLAMMLRHLRLSLWEQYLFAVAPADAQDSPVASALLSLASAYDLRGVASGHMCGLPPPTYPTSELELEQLEALHRIYDLYIWLAFRLEAAFPDRKLVEGWRAQCADVIRQGLENLGHFDDWEAVPKPKKRRLASISRTNARPHIQGTLSPAVVLGERLYSTRSRVRHFPKHLLRRPGEAPRPLRLSPSATQSDAEALRGNDEDEFDSQAPLVAPQRPRETRSERRVRKREEGITRVIERDFGKGILPPFSDEEDQKPEVLLPQYGPGMQPKKRKKSAKRKSSPAGPFQLS